MYFNVTLQIMDNIFFYHFHHFFSKRNHLLVFVLLRNHLLSLKFILYD